MQTVIIDNYDSFTFNLFQLLAEVSAEEIKVLRNDQINISGLKMLKPKRIVLSPGPGHPATEKDFGVCKDIIKEAQALNCPVLGVCLGHQGIVQHLGGKIIGAPQIVHGKASDIYIKKDSPIFYGLPKTFKAMRYHSLIAAEEQFPEELNIIACETKCNSIMAVEHKAKPLYGLQFHPESIGTPFGKQILKNFIEKC